MRIGNKPLGTIAPLMGVWAVPPDWAWSFAMMVQYNTEAMCPPGYYVHYDRATMSYHSFARNAMAQRMQGEWLLMLDTDHCFDPDLAVRMVHRLEAAQIDVLAGVYQYKLPPYSPVLYGKPDNDGLGYAPIGDWKAPEGGLLQIASAGAGCLLVRRRVFELIENELHELPFLERDGMSEDHSFFKRLELLGIPAYCDFRIQSPHLVAKQITLEDYDRSHVETNDFVEVPGIGVG